MFLLLAAQATVPVVNPYERSDMKIYNFDEMVGQRKVVTAENALSEQGGFYCEPCDYLLKDQKSYLEHCNKARHLQRVGLPTEVKRSKVDDIKARLALHAAKKKKTPTVGDSKKRALEELKAKPASTPLDTQKAAKSNDNNAKDAGSHKKAKSASVQAPDDDEANLAASLGLPMGFASSK